MNRRTLFKTAAGAAVAPFVLKAKEPETVTSVGPWFEPPVYFQGWRFFSDGYSTCYFHEDDLDTLHCMSFYDCDYFKEWRLEEGKLYWVGEHGETYQVLVGHWFPGGVGFHKL